MEAHLAFGDIGEVCRSLADLGEGVGFVGRQRIGARELDEEQVILNEIAAKSRLGQRAVGETKHEVMLGIGAPRRDVIVLQTIEQPVHVITSCCGFRSAT